VSRSQTPEEARRAVEEAVAEVRSGDFWETRARLALVRDWARARRAAPYAVLAEVLAAVACRIPPSVQLPALIGGPGSLNTITALTAPSGVGKGGAQAVALAAVEWPDWLGPVPIVPVGSGEGIAATFAASRRLKGGDIEVVRLRWSALLVAREIDQLAALADRKGATLSATLRQVWSGEEIGFGNASPDRRLILPRHSYRAALTVGVQPGHGEALLGDADGGLPQRVWWVPATDPDVPDTRPEEPGQRITWAPPEPVRLALADLDAADLDAIESLRVTAIPVCPQVHDAVDRAAVGRHRGDVDALDGHSLLCREKIAALLGMFAGHFAVTEEDWHLAGQLMDLSSRTRAAVADTLRRAEEQRNEARGHADAKRARIVRETEEADTLVKASRRIMVFSARPVTGWRAPSCTAGSASGTARSSMTQLSACSKTARWNPATFPRGPPGTAGPARNTGPRRD
jgi:hypothetical protein